MQGQEGAETSRHLVSGILHPHLQLMLILTPLLGLGFTNLAMLGWLAAAAAPLLIHLWSRHRFREVRWAAMQFLLAAMRKNARRMQLQQWLLLAVRTLLIMLVVLAIAEPYAEERVSGSASGPAHKVLVLDDSYSMAYRSAAESNFERAKNLAADVVRDSRAGDSFTVILMSEPPRTITGRETVDYSDVATQVESLPQPHAGADLPATLALVDDALSVGEKSRAISTRQEVYFFSDLQRITWQPAESPPTPSESAIRNPHAEIVPDDNAKPRYDLANLILPLAKRAVLNVIDVGQSRATNLAITRLATAEPFVTIDREILFEATLRDFGNQPHFQCPVELIIDGVPVAEQIVDVAAGGEATVRFSHRFRSPGNHTVAVRTTGDPLPIDNSRWLVVPTRSEVRVLLVAGREGAANYISDALNPNPAASSAIRPIVASEGDLAEIELSEFDCVFLCNVAQFTPNEAERLRNYAAAGGGIVFFLGDRVIPDAYHRMSDSGFRNVVSRAENSQSPDVSEPSTAAMPDSDDLGARRGLEPSDPIQPLAPARIGPLITKTQFGLDPLDYRHPIVAPFRGRERAGLLTTPVTRYYQLEIPQNRRGVEVAAATRDGHPFIVAAPLGRGRIILVATDGSLSSVDAATGEAWTTWPTWPSFLPIVREMLAFAAGGQREGWQQAVGTSLGGSLTDAAPLDASANLQILRPDGRTAPVDVQTSRGAIHWSYGTTDMSGIYSLRGSTQQELRQFAVNVDGTESDLARADPRRLPPQLLVRDTFQDANYTRANRVLSHAAWNEQLLWIAFALLFVESFLAWQFGRGAA